MYITKKKKSPLIGLIISCVIIILGIVIMATSLGVSHHGSYSYSSESGTASFGADFYTYVNNNAAEAAKACRTAANNLDSLITLVSLISGIFLIAAGAVAACCFSMHLGDTKQVLYKGETFDENPSGNFNGNYGRNPNANFGGNTNTNFGGNADENFTDNNQYPNPNGNNNPEA